MFFHSHSLLLSRSPCISNQFNTFSLPTSFPTYHAHRCCRYFFSLLFTQLSFQAGGIIITIKMHKTSNSRRAQYICARTCMNNEMGEKKAVSLIPTYISLLFCQIPIYTFSHFYGVFHIFQKKRERKRAARCSAST